MRVTIEICKVYCAGHRRLIDEAKVYWLLARDAFSERHVDSRWRDGAIERYARWLKRADDREREAMRHTEDRARKQAEVDAAFGGRT